MRRRPSTSTLPSPRTRWTRSTKKLIGLALSVLSKCEPCVKIHARDAKRAGASDEEIAEAVALAISFGGASVNMFYQTLGR